jgi:hypothetical protein
MQINKKCNSLQESRIQNSLSLEKFSIIITVYQYVINKTNNIFLKKSEAICTRVY